MPEIFLPSVKKEGEIDEPEIPPDTLAMDIFNLIAASPHQQRRGMRIHPLLMIAAQAKAEDMSALNYFAHTSPSGETANENIRKTGYKLPDYYPVKGNMCESLSVGGNRPADNVAGWYRSERHRGHVFGLDSFYRNQECIGVGHAKAQDDRHLYVFISAVCMG